MTAESDHARLREMGRSEDSISFVFEPMRAKNKSFGLIHSISVNHFDSHLNLIRFRYEIMWVVLDPYRLGIPSVSEDK